MFYVCICLVRGGEYGWFKSTRTKEFHTLGLLDIMYSLSTLEPLKLVLLFNTIAATRLSLHANINTAETHRCFCTGTRRGWAGLKLFFAGINGNYLFYLFHFCAGRNKMPKKKFRNTIKKKGNVCLLCACVCACVCLRAHLCVCMWSYVYMTTHTHYLLHIGWQLSF